jgi:hypothetical protein
MQLLRNISQKPPVISLKEYYLQQNCLILLRDGVY